MAAPTLPTIAQLAYWNEVDQLLEMLRQCRRLETAKGGTPAVTTAANPSTIRALIIQSLRALENLL